MHVHINHMFCTESIWGGMYTCSFMVSIEKYFPRPEPGPEGGIVLPPPHEDWKNLIDEVKIRPKALFDWPYIFKLKPEVFKWLEDNVKDIGGHVASYVKQNGKGFAIGSDAYNSKGQLDFSIFFYRRSDAMNFIKRWSVYKKPTTYFDYFKEVRRQYNFKTKTLQKVK